MSPPTFAPLHLLHVLYVKCREKKALVSDFLSLLLYLLYELILN